MNIKLKMCVLLISFGCCSYSIRSKNIGLHPYMSIINRNLLEKKELCGLFVRNLLNIKNCSCKILEKAEEDISGENLEILKKEFVEQEICNIDFSKKSAAVFVQFLAAISLGLLKGGADKAEEQLQQVTELLWVSFLELMRSNRLVMGKLLRQSLEDEPGVDINKSLLIKFISQPNLDTSFFYREIDSIDKLKSVCRELNIFVSQIADNLWDEVVAEFIKFLKQKQKENLSSEEKVVYEKHVKWLIDRKQKRDSKK